MRFRSTGLEWLVISGSRIRSRGSGTINGVPGYGFLLSAIDGDMASRAGPDRFRIRIWDKGNGRTVYDNEAGATDVADPSAGLTSGGIAIQKKR